VCIVRVKLDAHSPSGQNVKADRMYVAPLFVDAVWSDRNVSTFRVNLLPVPPVM